MDELDRRLEEAWQRVQEAHLALKPTSDGPVQRNHEQLVEALEATRHYFGVLVQIERAWKRSL